MELERRLGQSGAGSKGVTVAQDRRQEARLDVLLKVVGCDGEKDISAYIVNLNGNGMLLEGYEQITDGSYLCVKVTHPERNKPVEIHGRVLWVHLNAGAEPPTYQCGIVFEKLPSEAKNCLRLLMDNTRFGEIDFPQQED